MNGPQHFENHFPWYADPTDTTNIDCQCGTAIGDGVGGWAEHVCTVTAAPQHRIESSVQVYLLFDGERWVVDPITLDGSALDGLTVDGSECECGDTEAHVAEMAKASEVRAPTGAQLISLLREAAGGEQ
jgi:hypothetical protein